MVAAARQVPVDLVERVARDADTLERGVSPARKFNRFMVTVDASARPKVKRLKRAGKEVRWAWFHGVLPIAAEAPMRGFFMVGDLPADESDVAEVADVTIVEARKALETGRSLGMLYLDDEVGFERVHDWDEINPAPKVDATAAERARRYRERHAASRRDVTPASRRDSAVTDRDANGAVTPPEVEVEVEVPRTPPEGGRVVTFARRPVPADRLALAERLLTAFNKQAGTGHGAFTGRGNPSESLKRILSALADHPDVTEEQWNAAIAWRFKEPWWSGRPDTGVVFGPKAVGACLESAAASLRVDSDVHRKLLG